MYPKISRKIFSCHPALERNCFMGDHMPFNTAASDGVYSFTLEATAENYAMAQERVRSFLSPFPCSFRALLDLDMIVEEIFINIANYAYTDRVGTVTIELSLNAHGDTLTMVFRDSGIPYDPLRKETPDLTAPAAQRPIGGLGIFLVQELSDSISYKHTGSENYLTICKKIR